MLAWVKPLCLSCSQGHMFSSQEGLRGDMWEQIQAQHQHLDVLNSGADSQVGGELSIPTRVQVTTVKGRFLHNRGWGGVGGLRSLRVLRF